VWGRALENNPPAGGYFSEQTDSVEQKLLIEEINSFKP
jgi:hypothetical protein